MLSFYPEFEAEPMENIEYVFLLDLSCSMKVCVSKLSLSKLLSSAYNAE